MRLAIDMRAKAAYIELEPGETDVNLDVDAVDHNMATFNLIDILNSVQGLGKEPRFVGIEFLNITTLEVIDEGSNFNMVW